MLSKFSKPKQIISADLSGQLRSTSNEEHYESVPHRYDKARPRYSTGNHHSCPNLKELFDRDIDVLLT